jgi:FkbM family methyltransferase
MKLPLRSVRPALVNRLYRGAFRSGHGRDHGGLRQAVCRALFYPVEALRLPPGSKLEVDLLVRGREVTLRLEPWNRQFSPLYFSRYAGGYETTVARSIASRLPDDGVFLDVGSNWGYFPLLFASRETFGGRILAFEPVPATFAVIGEAGLEPWVEIRQAAVGAEDGEVSMHVPRHSGLARMDSQGAGVKVPVLRLDSLKLDRVDVIKVDVEGHELAVFEGARDTLSRLGPAIVFESGVGREDRWMPPLSFLEEMGYRLHRPELSGGELSLKPFDASERAGMDPYFNVLATRGA